MLSPKCLLGQDKTRRLIRMGTADYYPTTAMSYDELLVANHLTLEDIVKEAIQKCRN